MKLLPIAMLAVLVPLTAGSPCAAAATLQGPATPRGDEAPTSDAPALSAPTVLEDRSPDPRVVEVRLTAAPGRLSLVPGNETAVYAYNGTVPGPTLEAREGDRIVIHFRNELSEETTVHWHGLHIPWVADGSPYHPIAPGEEVEFSFTLHPGTAGTYWYHPHPHHKTASQVAMGLYGAIVVRGPDDPLEGIPEKLLILADNRFREDGSVDLPDVHSHEARVDFENGREGDVLFVNGQLAPTVPIRSGEVQRWRVINASASRVYRLSLSGHELMQVGSDGGLFEHPVSTDEILIANSDRVELLVRGTGAPGSRAVLQDLPYDRYVPQTRPAEWERTRDLLTLAYTDEEPAAPVALPPTLLRVPALDTTEVSARRVMTLTQGFINGKAMDMDRVDETAELGATEIWTVENLVGMDHPFHLHGFSFQVIERNGEPVTERWWEDTVNVPKHQTVRFVVRFDDYPGKWMFHCHILEHEQIGMMGVLEVR